MKEIQEFTIEVFRTEARIEYLENVLTQDLSSAVRKDTEGILDEHMLARYTNWLTSYLCQSASTE